MIQEPHIRFETLQLLESLQFGLDILILLAMLEMRLDAVASSLNFVGGVVLAIDALTARRRTKVKRGGQKLLEGLAGSGVDPESADGSNRSGQMQTSDGHQLSSVEALEDWADRLTTQKARFGFVLLATGFGLDLFSKVFCNPSLFAK